MRYISLPNYVISPLSSCRPCCCHFVTLYGALKEKNYEKCLTFRIEENFNVFDFELSADEMKVRVNGFKKIF